MGKSVLDRLEADYPQIPAVVRLKAALLFYGLQDNERQVKALVEAGDFSKFYASSSCSTSSSLSWS